MPAEARERLQALGYVGAQTDVSTSARRRRCPIRRTSARFSSATARRSISPASGKWPQAIALLQQILHDDPEMADVWSQLAVFATRDRSLRPGGRRLQALHRAEAAGADRLHRRRRPALLKLRKLDEAREHAELAVDVAAERRPSIAGVGARDAREDRAGQARRRRGARGSASWRTTADPTLPLPIYIDARLLYDQGKYADALPLLRSRRSRS